MNGTISQSPVPLIVQLGFSGSRHFVDGEQCAELDRGAFETALTAALVTELEQLRSTLHLEDSHVVFGLSSLAIGGDAIFARACEQLTYPHRVFLPQERELFLHAQSADGYPDFTEEQRVTARQLLDSNNVVEEVLASTDSDRRTRFEDVNLAILRESDVLICLMRRDAELKVGGTQALLEAAIRKRKCVVELRVSVGVDGQPTLSPVLHGAFIPPALSEPFCRMQRVEGIPALADYESLRSKVGALAREKRNAFSYAALAIVGTHILATALGTWALSGFHHAALAMVEFTLLACGLLTHTAVHASHAPSRWADARLVAELLRSALSANAISGRLQHLFDLPLPQEFAPLARTLNLLHLREKRASQPIPWQVRRVSYVAQRLDIQVTYYEGALNTARKWETRAKSLFRSASGGAILATALEVSKQLKPEESGSLSGMYARLLASPLLVVLAIVLPVLAVGSLSLAASMDLEARSHTYYEMLVFLREQRVQLLAASTVSEFDRLALEAEARLLGETATWHSRRAFTAVA